MRITPPLVSTSTDIEELIGRIAEGSGVFAKQLVHRAA
jgi:hypothetical protein